MTAINPLHNAGERERVFTVSELLDEAHALSDEHKFDAQFIAGVVALTARVALPEVPTRHRPTAEYIVRLAIGGPV